MGVGQWESSAEGHFTGNKRSRGKKKVSQQDSNTCFQGISVTKCRMDSGGARDQSGCKRGSSARR